MQCSGDVFAAKLGDIMTAAKQANPREDGDYEHDGLLYCGKCNTPKEHIITVCGTPLKVACMCRCRSAKFETERAEEQKRNRTEALKDRAFADKSLRDCTFENDDGTNPELTKKCRNYVENFAEFYESGKGLLLYGTCGTGKTYAALEIANALTDRMHSVRFSTFAAIANELFDNPDRQEYINALAQNYSLLIIDDYAAERNTPWMQEQLFSVIDARCKARKPLIVTTNLTRNQMFDKSDTARYRICSRLCELCIAIEASGKDRRIQQYINNKQHYEDLLNG